MTKPNHTFLAACRREKTPYTPVWLMRQAGRYMEEYRRLREQFGFLDLCKKPELAAEITVTPVERLKVDAAIIFADILLLLEPMNVGLDYSEANGPAIHHPIRSGADADRLPDIDPEDSLAYVLDAIRKSTSALGGRVPLIGFSGAPFTLASYLIEGGGSRNYLETKRFMYSDLSAWKALMSRLSRIVAGYLNAQIRAGAGAVQIFDSWVGCLSPFDYRKYVLPFMRETISALTPGTPVIHFSTGTAGLLGLARAAGGDIISVDWRVHIDEAWKAVGYDVGIQGNLDPAVLLGPIPEIRSRVEDILKRVGGRPGHIFNLGHGVLPTTPVDHVIRLVEFVHELSSH